MNRNKLAVSLLSMIVLLFVGACGSTTSLETATLVPPTIASEMPTATVEPSTATPASDPAIGEVLFNTSYLEASGRKCHYCHKAKTSDVTPLFTLVGFAAVAGDRMEGMSAEDYIRQAVLDPSFEGHDAYAGLFSEEEMNHLIAYVLSLE